MPGQSLGVPLTERGIQQAKTAADQVDKLVVGNPRIICSDALRARQTCAEIEARLGRVAAVDERLREQCLGELEGKPAADMVSLPVPEGCHITEVAWGGGESIADVHRRLAEFWMDITSQEMPETLILVAHADAFRVLEAVLAGRGHRDVDWSRPGLPLGGVALLELATH